MARSSPHYAVARQFVEVLNPFARVVDRNKLARNFLAAIRPLSTRELRDFLARSRRDNHGTEGEAMVISLLERELKTRLSKRGVKPSQRSTDRPTSA
jgi:hypothetical protein